VTIRFFASPLEDVCNRAGAGALRSCFLEALLEQRFQLGEIPGRRAAALRPSVLASTNSFMDLP
jgi:hypothetical protein